jgi:hypothetical protein
MFYIISVTHCNVNHRFQLAVRIDNRQFHHLSSLRRLDMSTNVSQGQAILRQIRIRRGLVFGILIVTALLAFEIFNYSTTDFALSDLLGDLQFLGIRWATILAIAFCGIDFAGIARLFTPQLQSTTKAPTHNESWYLFGAWLLAASMNAMLTWWGVSLAILGHQTLGNAVIARETLLRIVPIFVAVMVWLIRILIIGTFSVAGDRLFTQDDLRQPAAARPQLRVATNHTPVSALASRNQSPQTSRALSSSASAARPAPKPSISAQPEVSYAARPEPTYHPFSASAPMGTNGTNTLSDKPAMRPGNSFRR